MKKRISTAINSAAVFVAAATIALLLMALINTPRQANPVGHTTPPPIVAPAPPVSVTPPACPAASPQYRIEIVVQTIEPERIEKRVIPAVYQTVRVPIVRPAFTQFFYSYNFF